MTKMRFPLSSNQLELLLAFERATSMAHLTELMAKDSSVISRNMQCLAEELPVIEKKNGRWQMTNLGRKINEITTHYINDLGLAVSSQEFLKTSTQPCFSSNAVLLVINAQNAIVGPDLGKSSNELAVENIQRLLASFRKNQRPIIHVKHVSDNSKSLFYYQSTGVDFIPSLAPMKNEVVIEKMKSSAFVETNLSEILDKISPECLILTGFTANDCIDSTARSASDQGHITYVVGDATAMYDFSGHDGKLYKAERVHNLTMANLNALYAQVIETSFLLDF